MKADVRDAGIIGSISYLDLGAYLRTSGWQEIQDVPGRMSIWRSPDETLEILLPLTRGLQDYALRLGDAVNALSEFENRSALEILRDLATTSSDVIRIRLFDPDAANGTIPLEHAVVLVSHARDLLLASASAAIAPRAVYGPRRPARAVDYVRGTRLGQTEWGSFVITVNSPVGPELNDARFARVVDPFERKVTKTLAAALTETASAAERAALTGNFDAFLDRIDNGVSANFCDALVGMAGGVDANRDIAFEFTWSRVRPIHDGHMQRVLMTSDAIPIIAEAARVFREAGPIEDFEVAGPVIRLDRDNAAPASATILALVGGSARRVTVPLSEADYLVAIAAHRDRIPISSVGTLTREGRSWILLQPREVRLVHEDN